MNPPTSASASPLTLPDILLEYNPANSTDLELVWVAPTIRQFSDYSFQRELFIKANVFHRKFFKQNNTGIADEIYLPRLKAFEEAFKTWCRMSFGKRQYDICWYRDELVLSFDKPSYETNGVFNFIATPLWDKYNGGANIFQRSYEFSIENEEEITERATEYITENIVFFDTKAIWNSIKDGVIKPQNAVDYKDLTETHRTEKDFDEEECPCCFERLAEDPIVEGGFLGKCGHCVCVGCLKGLINSQHSNLVCPMCRDDWSCYNVKEVADAEEYEYDDVEEMKLNENFELLLEIVDINELRDYLVAYYGWGDILGDNQGHYCDYNSFYFSLDDYAISNREGVIVEVF